MRKFKVLEHIWMCEKTCGAAGYSPRNFFRAARTTLSARISKQPRRSRAPPSSAEASGEFHRRADDSDQQQCRQRHAPSSTNMPNNSLKRL